MPPKVSGAVVRNQLRAAKALSSEEAVERALSTLDPAAQRELRDALPVSWCSLLNVRAFHEAVAREVGTDADMWHKRVVEHAMEQTFNTVWRFFFRLTSADALVKRASAVYSRTFDTGSMEAELISPGRSIAHLRGWPAAPDFHLNAVATGISTMLRIARRRQITVTWTRTHEGARFEIYSSSGDASPESKR
jgi:hypothetical protein